MFCLKVPFLILVFIIFISPVIILAQPGKEWFTQNDRGNRFEGSYTKKVSNPSISLVSLTANIPNYTFGQKQKLAVRFYSPAQQHYDLHAEELLITQFYWLQDKNTMSQSGWNTFSNWQVDYLLKQFSVDSRNLGILVRLGESGARKFAPGFVYLEGEDNSSANRYIAQIRLGRPVEEGSLKVYLGESRTKGSLLFQQSITAKSSGTVFPIVFPFSKLNDQAAWITVEIDLKEKTTLDPFTYSFSFYHQPK